jgi:hypothetical protein
MVERADFSDPMLGAFRDPRLRDFSKIHYWKYRRWPDAEWPEGTRVLASFEGGDPAWLAIPIGRGTLAVLASGWHPDDSELARSTKFLPLLYSLLPGAGLLSGDGASLAPGDELPRPPGFDGTLEIASPDGASSVVSEADPMPRALMPGVYTIKAGDAARKVAVNLPASESRVEPVSMARLGEEFGVALAADASAEIAPSGEIDRSVEALASAESQQKAWRWIALGLMAVLIVESVIAGRRSAAPAPA